jgi:hypothetical protein
MRPCASALSIALVFSFLAGCAGANLAPTAASYPAEDVVPAWMHAFGRGAIPLRPFRYAAKAKAGIYASEFYGEDLFGYRNPNDHDAAPICHIAATFVNGFSVDGAGNLIVPEGSPTEVSIYKGPALCAKVIGTFSDPYGQASDAASANATRDTIVVGNIEVSLSDKVGNIAVCTLAKGCTRDLTSSTITYEGGGVAIAADGDCWMSSEDNASLSSATLTYFKGCKGSGQAAKGWKNAYYGGLIFDKGGNLIATDFNSAVLWVYKGCNPTCRVVGGPLNLEGNSFYGGLNAKGNELALGDFQYAQVDVYAYSPRKLTYKYSFNAGLTPSDSVNGAAFSPTF